MKSIKDKARLILDFHNTVAPVPVEAWKALIEEMLNGEKPRAQRGDRQEKILQDITEHPRASGAEIAHRLNMGISTTTASLFHLSRKGILSREKDGHVFRYEVSS